MENLVLINPNKNEETFNCFKALLPDDLESDRDASDKLFLGACDEKGNPLGTLIIDQTDDSYNISWIYVAPEYRMNGVGRFLINGFIGYVEESLNFKPVEAMTGFNQDDLKRFFAHLGNFEADEAEDVLELNAEAVKNSKILSKLPKVKFEVQFFNELPENVQDEFLDRISAEGYFTVLDKKQWRLNLIDKFCLCKVENNKITAAVFFSNGEDEIINLEFIYSDKQSEFMELLSLTVEVYLKKYSEKTIRMVAANPSVDRFVGDVFADCVKKDVRVNFVWNFE